MKRKDLIDWSDVTAIILLILFACGCVALVVMICIAVYGTLAVLSCLVAGYFGLFTCTKITDYIMLMLGLIILRHLIKR